MCPPPPAPYLLAASHQCSASRENWFRASNRPVCLAVSRLAPQQQEQNGKDMLSHALLASGSTGLQMLTTSALNLQHMISGEFAYGTVHCRIWHSRTAQCIVAYGTAGQPSACREYRSYIIKYFTNCCETEGIIIYS
jgi:hypothetical protein